MPDPDVYVYLDEFEKGDTFVLSAAFVPIDVASQLLADWDTLRKEIKSVLLKEYPHAAGHPKLQGNLLPEIHAVELFQSQGYYRKYEPGTNSEDHYWLKHYSWLEEAFQIIRKHDIRFIPFVYPKTIRAKMTDVCTKLFDKIFSTYKDDTVVKGAYSEKKLSSLAVNDYLFALPDVLVNVENYLRANKVYGEIVCDDHEMSKGFSVTESIDWLREGGHYKHLTRPRFANGLDESLLQVCDILCYVTGQFTWSRHRGIALKEPLNTWLNKYVLPSFTDIHPNLTVEPRHTTFMVLEILVESCVRDETVRAELKHLNRQGHEESSDNA